MRQISQTYKMLRRQDGAYYEVRVLLGNKVYTLSDLVKVEIHSKLFDDTGPQIGKACSRECDVTVIESSENWPRMAEYEVQVRIVNNSSFSEWLSMGTYYTDERSQDTATGTLTITGYDMMLQMEQFWTDVVPEEDLPESWPITAKAWLDMIEKAGLVALDSRNVIDNTIFFIGLDTTTTVRDVLKTIAAAHGGNWVVTFENELRLVPFVNADIPVGQVAIAGIAIAGIAIVGKEDYDLPGGFTDYQNLYMRIQSLETSPELPSVTGVRLETDAGTVMAAGTKTGYVLQGVCNTADTTGVAALCLNNTKDYVYRPFRAVKALLDPAAEIGDIVIIGTESYQMTEIDWDISIWPTADISAAFEEEVNHEYNYLDESAKNYQKSIRYTDGKADELQEEIVTAKTAIEQTAEAVALTAQAVGAERITQSLNLLHYPFSEEPVVTVSGLRFTYNYDGSVAVDGTATASVYTGFAGETELTSGTYTFSVETPPGFQPASSYTVPLRVKIGSSAYSLETVTQRDGKKIYSTSRSAFGNIGFILAVNSGETVHAVLYPQAVSGSSLRDWEPPVGAAVSDRLSQLESRLRVTAQGIISEVSRAQEAEDALIADVDVEYAKGESSTTAPTSGWSTTAPQWEAGYYIWQRTKTTTGGGSTTTSKPTCIQGAAATAYSLQVSHAVILDEGSGSYDPASITLSAKQQSGSASMTSYAGRFKIETTADGSSWTSRYTSSSNESSKSYTIPTDITFTAIRCSLYAAGGISILLDQEILPLISEGAQGEDGYTVVLTNSNHTFAGNETAAISGQSAECYVIAYKGATQMAVNIGTITGMPTGMPTPTISGNNTVNAKFTVSVTASMTTKSGVLTVPVTVDGKSFSMKFSYSLALAGEPGKEGIGVSAIVEQYYLSTSSTTQTGGSWGTDQPVWESGKYIWTRSEITWSDSTAQNPHIDHTDPVLAKAINGANETAYEVDQDMNFTVTQSRNIAPYPIRSNYTVYGVTFTFNPDGSITVKGTSTSSASSVLLTKSSFTKPTGKYLLFVESPSSFPTSGTYPFDMGAINSSNGLAALNNWSSECTQYSGNTVWYAFSDITGGSNFQIRVYLRKSAVYNHTIYPQMVLTDALMPELVPWSPPVGATLRLNAQMKYAYSQIVQTADGITSTVKKGDVISSINQSAEAITINANKLNLTGYITATDVGATGTTVINGSRISGGTLTLGGNNNGNGQINVKNASGTTIGTWTKDGISVDGGTIKGTTITGGSLKTQNYTQSGSTYSNGTDVEITNGMFSAYAMYNNTRSLAGTVGCSDSRNRHLNVNGNTSVLITSGGIELGVYGNSSIISVDGGSVFSVFTDFEVYGDKNRVVKTENYSSRCLSAFETPTPMFMDAGSGRIDESGKAYIFVEDIFAETIDLEVEYHVFLQKYGNGDCWVEERKPSFFLVVGTPGLKFCWEIHAKQKGFSQERLRLSGKESIAPIDALLQNDLDEQAANFIQEYYEEVER